MSELNEKLDDFKELLLDDIKDIALNHAKFDEFCHYITQEIDLKEHLLALYQQHAYNLSYEVEAQEGIYFLSTTVHTLTLSNIQASEDDCLNDVITKFVLSAFEFEIIDFLAKIS